MWAVLDQFLNDNINRRTDDYGGTPEKRCRFVLELLDALVTAVGQDKVAIRLTPFGLFNRTRGSQRLETWGHLCREIKRQWQLSYIHFVEPRYEQIVAPEEKQQFLESWGLKDITLEPFRDIMGDTPLFSAGGWNHTNSWGLIETGQYEALVYGRYFLANPDFVER
jgi:2,4-dienoyl-CoA reductase-like NADH-dependent reductase (Old Yellow Enzyme family)